MLDRDYHVNGKVIASLLVAMIALVFAGAYVSLHQAEMHDCHSLNDTRHAIRNVFNLAPRTKQPDETVKQWHARIAIRDKLIKDFADNACD